MAYNPEPDVVDNPAVLSDFIARHPLAALVTHDGTTPQTDFIPLMLVPDDAAPTGQALIGHVARNNQLWHEGKHEGLTLATFGPVEHYISPSWYPSKAETHRVVPTWNYLVVHAWGHLDIHDDPKWVRAVVARLTNAMESGRDEPWRMGQAPKDYLEAQIAAVVGIRLPIERLEGRFKVSTARSEADRLGARDGIVRELRNVADEGSPVGRGGDEVVEAMSRPPQWRSSR